MEDFLGELTDLLNKYGKDADTNTSDHHLAEFLYECLMAYTQVVQYRDKANKV